MTGKLLARLACTALALACPAANATRLLVAPLPGEANGGFAAVLSRAVESAALDRLQDVEVVTPGALEQKLELDMVKACTGDGDDAACVVEFAAAMGVDYVLRQRLSEVKGDLHLTLSLYDGARAQLVAQGTRAAPADAPDRLLEQVPALVVEIARKARMPVAEDDGGPSVAGAALLGTGALGLALGVLGASGSALLDAQYFDAQLDRDGARTWEGARLFAYGAAGATAVAGVALLTTGVLLWE